METTSRRRFLAGAIATSAAPLLPGTEPAAAFSVHQVKQRILHRGRAIAATPGGGRLVVAHERRRTIAIVARGHRRFVDVGGQPVEVAISPGGGLAAVTTGFWDEPGLAIVDLRRGKLRRRLKAGDAPFDVAFSSDGERIIVSGGEEHGEVRIFDAHHLKQLRRVKVGANPRGIAPVPGESRAWVALNGRDRLLLLDLETGRIRRRLATPRRPDRVAVSPDGHRLLVSHSGSDAEFVNELNLSTHRLIRHRVGRLPSAVAWSPRGHRLIALGGAGEIVEILDGGRRRRHRVGGAPRGLTVAGGKAWTVDALSGRISGVRV
jgi:DNA-binding beta-propeller fold protein YncE